MVLTKRIFIGLFLLVLVTSTTTISIRRHRQVTTPPNENVTTTTTTTTEKTTQKPLIPKTEENATRKTKPRQVVSTTATTTKSPEIKQNKTEETAKIDRQDTGRSLDITREKYLAPEYHSENNVYSESKIFEKEVSKPMEYEKFFDTIQMTTPKDDHFDHRHRELQEEMSKTMDEMDRTFGHDDYKTRHRFDDDFKTTPIDEAQMNVRGYKQIDSSESRLKNKVHMDYNMEEGKKMEMIKTYNETKIIPEKKLDVQKTENVALEEASENKVTVSKPETTTTKLTKTTPKPIRQIKPNRNQSKPLDLDQESSIQVSNIHIQEIDPNLIKILNNTDNELTKEQLDPIIPNDKEILISKRGKPKLKTTPVDNLEDLNVVEVTTTMKKNIEHQSSTESILKNQKIASLDMKTVDVISSKEISSETTMKIEEATTMFSLEDTTLEIESTTELGMSTTTEGVSLSETTTDVVTETTVIDKTEGITVETTRFDDATTTLSETTTILSETPTTLGETTTDLPTTSTPSSFDEDMTNFRGLMEEILTNSTEVPIYETTTQFFEVTDSQDATFYEVSTTIAETTTEKAKNDSNLANEIIKLEPKIVEETTKIPDVSNDLDNSTKINDNDIIKQNEINVNNDKVIKSSTTEEPIEKDCEAEPCDETREPEHDEDYIEGMPKKTPDMDELDDNQEKLDKFGLKMSVEPTKPTTQIPSVTHMTTTTQKVESRKVEVEDIEVDVTTMPSGLTDEEEEGGNGGKIAAIVISAVGGVCLFLLVGLLIIMRKRQKRFNYGQRCRPVSLDAYNMDNVSIHNSTRRKGVLMASKRSYGNPAFEDPNCPSHPLNYPDLLKFAKNTEEVYLEFEKIPQVQAKTSELPDGCEAKNRYANVIPLPETRVFLTPIDGHPNSDYINANYVTGAKSQRRYYIASQAPMLNTIEDFWRMVWEQESKVILMLTHLYEQGVEKCIDYLPPSEVLDCHRLFGDFQITLKKREVRDKYIISSLQLKNMVSNSWREVTHMWYMEWPHKGVPDEANSMIRFLIEARSYIKSTENKTKEGNTSFINGSTKNNGSSPVVVHCSPGTGRTGTVIACDIAIREFEMTRIVDIPKIVYKIRRDRASSVQTKDQYSYIYNVINFYATKLTGGAFDSF